MTEAKASFGSLLSEAGNMIDRVVTIVEAFDKVAIGNRIVSTMNIGGLLLLKKDDTYIVAKMISKEWDSTFKYTSSVGGFNITLAIVSSSKNLTDEEKHFWSSGANLTPLILSTMND